MAETKTETSLTETQQAVSKAKKLRLLFRCIFALVGFIAPLVIIGFKFKLFSESSGTGYKLSVMFIVALIIAVWRFKKRIMDWINEWEYSILKYILIGFSRVYVFILVVVIILLARNGLENLIFVLEWLCICECAAYLLVYPVEQYYNSQVLRLTRKDEREADYVSAMKLYTKQNSKDTQE